MSTKTKLNINTRTVCVCPKGSKSIYVCVCVVPVCLVFCNQYTINMTGCLSSCLAPCVFVVLGGGDKNTRRCYTRWLQFVKNHLFACLLNRLFIDKQQGDIQVFVFLLFLTLRLKITLLLIILLFFVLFLPANNRTCVCKGVCICV